MPPRVGFVVAVWPTCDPPWRQKAPAGMHSGRGLAPARPSATGYGAGGRCWAGRSHCSADERPALSRRRSSFGTRRRES